MSCYLIKELLPLYIEGDCSAETKKIVEEHLRSCEICSHLYREMIEPIPLIKMSGDPIPYMDENEEKRKFKERYFGKLLLRACIAFGIVYVVMVILYWFK
ncbi:anti-sigma factor family protein [Bacillus sp. NPDC093026]|uniref:anti-sigma factor family protein n=1 Tax=Bacillus sp. NPDC093026 TaxID=3363948 RepID=UPI00381E3467